VNDRSFVSARQAAALALSADRLSGKRIPTRKS
jgi:hypothetical protein